MFDQIDCIIAREKLQGKEGEGLFFFRLPWYTKPSFIDGKGELQYGPKETVLAVEASRKTTGRESAEDRQLAPMMRALKAIHSVGTPDSMNPEDLAKQRAAQEVLGRLVAPMIVMKKWETFHLKEMACAWVKPDWPTTSGG